ncbi:hypothetical protein B0A48_10047 [Cryoendolithus antarcticus]|uniref:Rhodopsin domain-containing protein n=1 Tax=Cryoendolithus antarcticus TaxID=1507870 RepID=A0A1V8T3W2_9PEZI|nr:hypothetical protein B0A48_10047 [Cryoendolithus antarcticus]
MDQISAKESSSMQNTITSPVSLADQTYGDLQEGFKRNNTTSLERFVELRAHYRRRRWLAALCALPEGASLTYEIHDGSNRRFRLLTPPGMVVVRRQDGICYKIRREETVHGPQPYTTHWYQEYVRRFSLPVYFLSSSHLSMLQDTTEASHLDIVDIDRTWPTAPERHLALGDRAHTLRFPILPGQNLGRCLPRNSPTDAECSRLGSRFPALLTPGPNPVVILRSDGYIRLSSSVQLADIAHCVDIPHIARSDLVWRATSSSTVPGSFCEEPPAATSAPAQPIAAYNGLPKARDMASMHAAQSDARRRGGTVNPQRLVPGAGKYSSLDAYDQQHAENPNVTHAEITQQRQGGVLGHVQGPHQVWYPDLRFVNPGSLPEGAGQSQYVTEDDEELAHLHLGGVQDNIMPDNPTDRRRYLGSAGTLAGGEQPNKYGWTVRKTDARQCEPTNNGPGTHVDQSRTPGKAKYCLATKAGQNIVPDRSPPIRGQVKEHLFNIRGVNKWLRFKQADTMDWRNTNHIKKLNDFRTQNFRREIYDSTTRPDRESHTSDETKWLTDEVRKDLLRGMQSVKDLVRTFNAKGSLTHVVRDAVNSVKEILSRRSSRSGISRESAAEPENLRMPTQDGADQSGGSNEYMDDGTDLRTIIASFPTPNYTDPALIGFAWLGSIALTTFTLLVTQQWGADRHVWDVPPQLWPVAARGAWALEVIYLVTTCCIKVSILLFYRRLTAGTYARRWKIATIMAIVFTVIYALAFLILLMNACKPLEAYWDSLSFFYDKPYTCIHSDLINPINGALAAFGDAYAVMLPILMLRHFGAPRRQKIALNIVFALGLITVCTASVRTYYFTRVGMEWDATWLGFDTLVWTQLEVQLAMICASAPALRVLVRRYLSDPFQRTFNGSARAESAAAMYPKSPDVTIVSDEQSCRDPESPASNEPQMRHLPSIQEIEHNHTAPLSPATVSVVRSAGDYEMYALQNLEKSRLLTRGSSLRFVSPSPNNFRRSVEAAWPVPPGAVYNATGDYRNDVLRVQYLARLRLADLRTAPEGIVITQRMSDGTDKQLCVLTPPNMVAVRNVNGKWSRFQRRESVHGPAPYSMAFWVETT